MQGSELKSIRQGLGMSQSEFGAALDMTATFIGMMERGDRPIERRTALAARHLLLSRELGDTPLSERIARALWQFSDPRKDLPADGWRDHLPAARAIITTLRIPNVAMIDAGNAAMRAAWAERGLAAPSAAGDAAVEAAWSAMIDVARTDD